MLYKQQIQQHTVALTRRASVSPINDMVSSSDSDDTLVLKTLDYVNQAQETQASPTFDQTGRSSPEYYASVQSSNNVTSYRGLGHHSTNSFDVPRTAANVGTSPVNVFSHLSLRNSEPVDPTDRRGSDSSIHASNNSAPPVNPFGAIGSRPGSFSSMNAKNESWEKNFTTMDHVGRPLSSPTRNIPTTTTAAPVMQAVDSSFIPPQSSGGNGSAFGSFAVPPGSGPFAAQQPNGFAARTSAPSPPTQTARAPTAMFHAQQTNASTAAPNGFATTASAPTAFSPTTSTAPPGLPNGFVGAGLGQFGSHMWAPAAQPVGTPTGSIDRETAANLQSQTYPYIMRQAPGQSPATTGMPAAAPQSIPLDWQAGAGVNGIPAFDLSSLAAAIEAAKARQPMNPMAYGNPYPIATIPLGGQIPVMFAPPGPGQMPVVNGQMGFQFSPLNIAVAQQMAAAAGVGAVPPASEAAPSVSGMSTAPSVVGSKRETKTADPSDDNRPIMVALRAGRLPSKLDDIIGHVVAVSGDQNGSRFIQERFSSAHSSVRAQIFNEVLPNALPMARDVYGNYVVQLIFLHGTQAQKLAIAKCMTGQVAQLSLNTYACRVVQAAFENVLAETRSAFLEELRPRFMEIATHVNGNHVMQQAIQHCPASETQWIMDEIRGNAVKLSQDQFMCRVMQRMTEHFSVEDKRTIFTELFAKASELIDNQFGNYVIQNIVREAGGIKLQPDDKEDCSIMMINMIMKDFADLSMHKFASNIIETCIATCAKKGHNDVLSRMIAIVRGQHKGEYLLTKLLGDAFGNFVVQTLMKHAPLTERPALIAEVSAYRDKNASSMTKKHLDTLNYSIAFATGGSAAVSGNKGFNTRNAQKNKNGFKKGFNRR